MQVNRKKYFFKKMKVWCLKVYYSIPVSGLHLLKISSYTKLYHQQPSSPHQKKLLEYKKYACNNAQRNLESIIWTVNIDGTCWIKTVTRLRQKLVQFQSGGRTYWSLCFWGQHAFAVVTAYWLLLLETQQWRCYIAKLFREKSFFFFQINKILLQKQQKNIFAHCK